MKRITMLVLASIVTTGLLAVSATSALASYGPGEQYQIALSSNISGPQGGGVWLWIALNANHTGDYAGSDCGHGGAGAASDKGDVTWQQSGDSLVISGVQLNGLGGIPDNAHDEADAHLLPHARHPRHPGMVSLRAGRAARQGADRNLARARRQLYNAPKQLVEHGLANASREPAGARHRTIYSITESGRAALRAWLSTDARPAALEVEGMLHVLLADQGSLEDLERTLEQILQQAPRAAPAVRGPCRVHPHQRRRNLSRTTAPVRALQPLHDRAVHAYGSLGGLGADRGPDLAGHNQATVFTAVTMAPGAPSTGSSPPDLAYARPSVSYSRRNPSNSRRWPSSSRRIAIIMSLVTGSTPSVTSMTRL
jgi:hypothetical protein